ncbi:MAG: uracil-DNA glycosylase [SAR202 cluster bacterium]|jgi:DNA polymerase|nr:uracil-DNA glycosylase [SAR202 cluster bacterium]
MSDFDTLVNEIKVCHQCALSSKRTNAVPGEGALTADIMFIGEAPGFREDQLARPFVGPAGKFLDELLSGIGLRRDDVYITNMVKCRPPNNRDPLPEEMASCKTYLERQIKMIGPSVIVLLGRHSFARFFPGESIGKARGRPRLLNGLKLFPMYHPAAALHNPALRPVISQDFKRLKDLIADPGPNPATFVEPEQLSLL